MIELSVLKEIVVAGMVRVSIDMMAAVPRPVAGIALPRPLLVQGDGLDIVEVSGFADAGTDPL